MLITEAFKELKNLIKAIKEKVVEEDHDFTFNDG